MEVQIDELQRELYVKTKHLEKDKNKEIEKLEQSLREQFETEISTIQTKNKTAQEHNKEIANEVLRLTNENSTILSLALDEIIPN